MSWTVIIPLNVPARRKSRLSSALPAAHRETLAEELYRHVFGCVERTGLFDDIITLSPAPAPMGVQLQEMSDLNAEFSRLRASLLGSVMVLNADLPLLAPEDLHALVNAAGRTGCALAVDRHWLGTNAVALRPGVPFQFAFGPGSLSRHLQSAPQASVLRRAGLACDLDTPADISHVLASGHRLPERVDGPMREARTSRLAHAQ